SGMAFRVGVALLAGVLVPIICVLVGYDGRFVTILALTLLGALFGTIATACQDALRGFERTDFAAGCFVGWQLLSAAAVVPTLLAGGGIYGLLIAQITCAALGAAFVLWMIPRFGVPRLAVRSSTMKDLARRGRPFLVF